MVQGERVEYPFETALGHLCSGGIATMAEILDPDGVWTSELIALMLPVAIERESEQVMNYFGATLAAISSLAGKEGVDAFADGIESIKAQTRNAAREARGLEPVEAGRAKRPGSSDADKMLKIASKMGMRVTKGKKSAKQKKAPQPTRVHKGKRK